MKIRKIKPQNQNRSGEVVSKNLGDSFIFRVEVTMALHVSEQRMQDP